MNPPTQFSFNAYQRVREQLTMEPDEVAALLDGNLALKIGGEKEAGLVHRLFYSRRDAKYFIAVQAEKSQRVAAILPLDYYEKLTYKIQKIAFIRAKRLVSPADESVRRVRATPPKPAVTPPLPEEFKVRVTVSGIPWHLHTLSLGFWPALKYESSIARLLQDAEFIQAMQAKIKFVKRPGEQAVGLLIRLGKNGEETWIKIEEDEQGGWVLSPPEIPGVAAVE
jgi:hypothetical protein